MGKRLEQEGSVTTGPKKVRKRVGAKTGDAQPRTKNPTSSPSAITESFVGKRRFPLAFYGFDDGSFHGALLVRRTWEKPLSWSYQLGYNGTLFHSGFEVQVVKGWSSYETNDHLFRVAVATGISQGCKVGDTNIAVGVPTIMVLLAKAASSESAFIVVSCCPKVGIRLHRLPSDLAVDAFKDFRGRGPWEPEEPDGV